VKGFLDNYARENKSITPKSTERLKHVFERMLKFADKHFPNGFHREKYNTTPRVRFEAMSVGIALALDKNDEIKPTNTDWAESDEFLKLTTSDGSNSRPKVVKRIEFVRDTLLNEK
jgi:hypothetical protein